EGGPHPLAGLANGEIRQADDGERRQAALNVHLDVHRPRRDAVEGEGPRLGEHTTDARPARLAGDPRDVTNQPIAPACLATSMSLEWHSAAATRASAPVSLGR